MDYDKVMTALADLRPEREDYEDGDRIEVITDLGDSLIIAPLEDGRILVAVEHPIPSENTSDINDIATVDTEGEAVQALREKYAEAENVARRLSMWEADEQALREEEAHAWAEAHGSL